MCCILPHCGVITLFFRLRHPRRRFLLGIGAFVFFCMSTCSFILVWLSAANLFHSRMLHDLCQKYVRTMPENCKSFAGSMPELCQNYARVMPELCQNHARSMSEMSELCQSYDRSLPEILCQNHDESAPELFRNLPDVCLWRGSLEVV